MFVPEEIEKEIGGNRYLIKAFPALYGLNVLNTLKFMDNNPSADFLKDVVLKAVTCNNIQPTEEWFNATFSRNYEALFELFQEIIEFNFGDKVDGKKTKKVTTRD